MTDWRHSVTEDDEGNLTESSFLKDGQFIESTFPKDNQVGGNHYKSRPFQPIEYIQKNGLGFLEGCVIKRITRYNLSGGKGIEDLDKIIHEVQLLKEYRYGEV